MTKSGPRVPVRRSNLIWLIGLAAGVIAGVVVAYSVAAATLPLI